MKKLLFLLITVNAAQYLSAQTNAFPSSGNVGIGTANPLSQFHLASDNDHAFTISRADGTYGFRILRNATAGNVYFQIGTTYNSWETKIKIGEGEGPNTKMLFNPDGGNVGIGKTNPQALLDVAGQLKLGRAGLAGTIDFARPADGNYQASAGWATDEIFRQYFSGGGSSYRIAGWANDQLTDFVTVTNVGNVGIGTTSPGYKLDVQVSAPTKAAYFQTSGSWQAIDFSSDGGTTKGSLAAVAGKLYIGSTGLGTNPFQTIDLGSGNVGIGTTSPSAKFHVNGGQIIETSGTSSNTRTLTLMNAGSSQMNLAYYSGSWRSALQIQNNNATKALFLAPAEADYNYSIIRSVNGGLKIDVGGAYNDNGINALSVDVSGNVAIGTADTQGYKLAVNGNAIFTKVKVKIYASWPDYVFHHNYKLLPLKDLENYIKQNNHLPDVPSASEVEENGLDLSDNQATLLKKIEELTMYIIEQNKKIEKLESQNKELQDLKNDVESIKSKMK